MDACVRKGCLEVDSVIDFVKLRKLQVVEKSRANILAGHVLKPQEVYHDLRLEQ